MFGVIEREGWEDTERRLERHGQKVGETKRCEVTEIG